MKITYSKQNIINGFKTVEARVDKRVWELRNGGAGGGWFATFWRDGKQIHETPYPNIIHKLNEAKMWFEGLAHNDYY